MRATSFITMDVDKPRDPRHQHQRSLPMNAKQMNQVDDQCSDNQNVQLEQKWGSPPQQVNPVASVSVVQSHLTMREKQVTQYLQVKSHLSAALAQITMKTVYALEKVKKPTQEMITSLGWLCEMIFAFRGNEHTQYQMKTWKEMIDFLLFTPLVFQEIKAFLKKIEEGQVDQSLFRPLADTILNQREAFLSFKDKNVVYNIVLKSALMYQLQEELLQPVVAQPTISKLLSNLKSYHHPQKGGFIKKKQDSSMISKQQTIDRFVDNTISSGSGYQSLNSFNLEQFRVNDLHQEETYEYPRQRMTLQDGILESPEKQKVVMIDLSQKPTLEQKQQPQQSQLNKFKIYLTEPSSKQTIKQVVTTIDNSDNNEQYDFSPNKQASQMIASNNLHTLLKSQKRQAFTITEKQINAQSKSIDMKSDKSLQQLDSTSKQKLFNTTLRIQNASTIKPKVNTHWKKSRQQSQFSKSEQNSFISLKQIQEKQDLLHQSRYYNKDANNHSSQQKVNHNKSLSSVPGYRQNSCDNNGSFARYTPQQDQSLNSSFKIKMMEPPSNQRLNNHQQPTEEERAKREKSLELSLKRDRLIEELSKALFEEKQLQTLKDPLQQLPPV